MVPAISKTEKFFYVGIYNVNLFSTYTITDADDAEAAYGFVNLAFINGIANPNLLTTSIHNEYSIGTSESNTTSFISEKYTANTLGKGQISWGSNYPSNSGNTAGGVQNFMVLGKAGIYQNVTRVVIDFTNNMRVVYFIGNK